MRFLSKILIVCILSGLFFNCNNQSENSKPLTAKDSLAIEVQKMIDAKKISDSPFAIVICRDVNDKKNDTLSLFGKFKLDYPVTLIDNKNGFLFETTTSGYFGDLYTSADSWVETKLKDYPKNKKHTHFIAYFGNKPTDYKLISSKKVISNDTIKLVDSLIKIKNDNIDTLLCDDIKIFKKHLPILNKFSIEGKDFIIATYKVENEKLVSGPRFLILNDNEILPLSEYGPCSFNDFSVFFMNGKYYLETGSVGCGSGVYGVQVYEFRKNSVKEVFSDFSLSD